jgi:hypothetical protein
VTRNPRAGRAELQHRLHRQERAVPGAGRQGGTGAGKESAGNVAANAEVSAAATQVAQQTGENIRVGKSAQLKAPAGGKCGLYLYGITGKIGVIMSFTGSPSDELITDLGGHIAFSKPLALTRDGINAELVEKERALAVEQAKAPANPSRSPRKSPRANSTPSSRSSPCSTRTSSTPRSSRARSRRCSKGRT